MSASVSPQSASIPGATDAATTKLARISASEALHMASLQHRRIRSPEPDDETSVSRLWADLQFFIVSLSRLRRAAELAANTRQEAAMRAAISRFEQALPDLNRIRNVGEHFDEYAVGCGNDKTVMRRDLLVGSLDDDGTYRWHGGELNIDYALRSAEDLYRAIGDAHRRLGPT